MKQSRVLSLVLLTFICILFSCSDNTEPEPEDVLTAGIQVDINGETHNLEVQGVALSNGGRFLAITGIETATGDQIDIRLGSFNNYTAPLLSVQEYEIIGNEVFVTYALDLVNTFPNTEVLTLNQAYHGGDISITELDTANTIISGTFSGIASTGSTDYNMTNGRFTNLAYTFYE